MTPSLGNDFFFQVNQNGAWTTRACLAYFRLFAIRRKSMSASAVIYGIVHGVLGLAIMTRMECGVAVTNANECLNCIHRKLDEVGRS